MKIFIINSTFNIYLVSKKNRDTLQDFSNPTYGSVAEPLGIEDCHINYFNTPSKFF